jgi:hypothetical protein
MSTRGIDRAPTLPKRGGFRALPHDVRTRGALELDVLVTGLNGLAYLVAAGPLGSLFGMPSSFIRVVGLFLLAFAGTLWVVATRTRLRPSTLRVVAAVNVVWVLASIAFLASGWHSPSSVGVAWTLLQAAVVALLAALQFALSRGPHR